MTDHVTRALMAFNESWGSVHGPGETLGSRLLGDDERCRKAMAAALLASQSVQTMVTEEAVEAACEAYEDASHLSESANFVYMRAALQVARAALAQPVERERTEKEWQALLNGRDEFLVRMGLWGEFVDSLPKPPSQGER